MTKNLAAEWTANDWATLIDHGGPLLCGVLAIIGATIVLYRWSVERSEMCDCDDEDDDE